MFGMKHRREYYVPKGAMKFADRESSAVVYAYERNGKPYLIGFHGRAQKPDFHYSYRSKEQREAKARSFFEGRRLSEAFRKEQRVKAVAQPRGLEVGDILRSMWGYDQTNIDYYEVTGLIGKRMVEIREIAQGKEECDGWLMGKCVPLPGQYVSEPMRRMASAGGVKIDSCSNAYRVEPQVIAGVPTYQPDSWTAYH